MKRKALISASLAAGILLGTGTAAAFSQIEQQQGLNAEALTSGTTTDGWRFYAYDDYCEITGGNEFVQGDVAMPASITLADGVTTLPVKKVNDIFYYSCENITGLTIPASITVLPRQFCESKKNLKTVTFEGALVSLPALAFSSCSVLEKIKLPENLSEIGSNAFQNCVRLSSIDLPESVSTLGSYAFKGCESLKSIEIPGSVTEIPDSAFSGCTALASVKIGDGVKKISSKAFYGCTSLTEVTFPKSVTSIEASEIFGGCNNLESVTIENPDCKLGNLAGTAEKPLIIYGYEGSTAEEYCVKRTEMNGSNSGVEFKSIGEKPAPQPVNDYGEFCDANGDGDIDSGDAQLVLNYYVEAMSGNKPSWYEITKNPKAPDAP